MVPLILGVVAAFATGGWVGSIVDDATEKEAVIINTETTTTNTSKALSTKQLLIAGALGVGALFIYKKFLKGK